MRGVNRPLRWEIEDQMKLHGYNLNQVAELAGINAGNLSRALNGVPVRSQSVIWMLWPSFLVNLPAGCTSCI